MRPSRICILFTMRHWTARRLSVCLLLGVLAVIVLVLVLPQVDLLDTAFHGGPAPILVHAQGTEKPAFQTLPGLLLWFLMVAGLAIQRTERRLLRLATREVRILNHCFRC